MRKPLHPIGSGGTAQTPFANTSVRVMTTKQDTITDTKDTTGVGLGGGFQVILHNDDHTPFDYVVGCLMQVFNHSQEMSVKIAMEAHTRGRAIAQVEEEESAMKHCLALRNSGLGADVEHI